MGVMTNSPLRLIGVFVLYFLSSCGNAAHDNAKKVAKQIDEKTKQHSPGTVATSESSYYMKATINGKQWIATHMMPDEDANSSYLLIHGVNGEDYMNFQLWKRGIQPGKSVQFSDDHASNLSLESDDGLWSGRSGEVVITRMDGKWLEGIFSYSATSSSSPGKIISVTDGYFRVPFELPAN